MSDRTQMTHMLPADTYPFVIEMFTPEEGPGVSPLPIAGQGTVMFQAVTQPSELYVPRSPGAGIRLWQNDDTLDVTIQEPNPEGGYISREDRYRLPVGTFEKVLARALTDPVIPMPNEAPQRPEED